MGPIRLLGLVGLGLLGGCSGEQTVEPEPERQQVPVEVLPYRFGYEDVERANTRAWIPPTVPEAYSLVAGTEDNKIGICFTQNGAEPQIGQFFKSSGKWRCNVDISSAGEYFLYGYAPHVTGMSCEISSYDTPGDNSAYSEGAVLTIKNVSTISPNDVCVLVGAKNGKDDYKEEPLDFEVTGLLPGQFAYHAEPMGPGGGNYAFLLFDHVFSALRLYFNVNAEYSLLRTIKVKELRLKTYTGFDVNQKKCDVTVKLNKTTGGVSPIEDITFTPTGGDDDDGSIFFTSTVGEELPVENDVKEFVAHFMPEGVTKLELTSTYDVYDRKGNLVRENSKATNTIPLDIFSGQSEFYRGSRYTITLTVNPTYLYVLSEDELDSPTLVVN